MGHGITWLSFLPGYQQIEHYLQSHYRGVLGSPVGAQHMYSAVLVTLILWLIALRARMQLNRAGENAVIPDARVNIRNVLEVSFEALYRQSKQIIGKDASRYFPVIGTLALFIFVSNVLGLVPGFSPPTDNLNTTVACGGFVFLYYNFHGLRKHGMGHIAHLANPTGAWWGWFLAPLMFPIEVVSHIARPVSLGIRLAANMTGDHAVLAAALGMVPLLVPLPFMALGLLVCVVQTMVFALLSMIYIGMSVADAHGDDAHAH
ncbi:MAG: F0F1 ATP synthase subunit A [Myxococcota bacterium]